MNGIRLHLLAVPHTITNSQFSHCAFTGKVQRFSPMMRSRGFEVFHYGNEGSESGANQDFQIFSKEEWRTYRILSLRHLHKDLTEEDAIRRIEDPKEFVGELANWSTPLYEEFNRRLKPLLKENYRSPQTDIVCIPLGNSYDTALANEQYTVVETGIGYNGSCKDYRIFESYCWLNRTLGKDDLSPPNYWFVIPNYYDIHEFSYRPDPVPNRIGFLGRIIDNKGCTIINEVAKRFPHVEIFMCGQGNPTPFLREPNVVYKPPIHGKERQEYLGSCAAVLTLTKYLEPFCGVNVEAQLCGTPVISHDHGGMVETIEQYKSGVKCHTLAEICAGVKMALDGRFNRAYIRKRATEMFDMYNLAYKYEYVFRTVLEIPKFRGWYSPNQYLGKLCNDYEPQKLRIALLLQGNVHNVSKTGPLFKNNVKNMHEMDVYLGHNTELQEDLTECKSLLELAGFVDEPIQYLHDYTQYPGLRSDTNLHTMLTRFINRSRVQQCLEQSTKSYDFVVSCFVNTQIDEFLHLECLPKDDNRIFVPMGDDWNGLNYRIAIGTPNAMQKYMTLYENLVPLLKKGCIPHPETLMQAHVLDVGLEVTRIRLAYKTLM